jgi:hypothetical protein
MDLFLERLRIAREIRDKSNLVSLDIDITAETLKALNEICKEKKCDMSELVSVILYNFFKTDFSKDKDFKCLDIAEMLILLESESEIKEEYIIFNNFDFDNPFMMIPPYKELLKDKA